MLGVGGSQQSQMNAQTTKPDERTDEAANARPDHKSEGVCVRVCLWKAENRKRRPQEFVSARHWVMRNVMLPFAALHKIEITLYMRGGGKGGGGGGSPYNP